MRVAANGNNGNNYKGVVKVEKWPGRYNIIKFTLHACRLFQLVDEVQGAKIHTFICIFLPCWHSWGPRML